jgi:hypothetical protein
MLPATPCTSMAVWSWYEKPRRAPPKPVWQRRGNMLCDRAVTLVFDASPEGGVHDGRGRRGARCEKHFPASH